MVNMKKIKFLRPEVIELIQDGFDALIERDYEALCDNEGYSAGKALERNIKKAETAILALQMTMDTADICEEAHKRTVRECNKLKIRHTIFNKKQDESRYTARAQRIFDRHFDEVEAWAEENKIRIN